MSQECSQGRQGPLRSRGDKGGWGREGGSGAGVRVCDGCGGGTAVVDGRNGL